MVSEMFLVCLPHGVVAARNEACGMLERVANACLMLVMTQEPVKVWVLIVGWGGWIMVGISMLEGMGVCCRCLWHGCCGCRGNGGRGDGSICRGGTRRDPVASGPTFVVVLAGVLQGM